MPLTPITFSNAQTLVPIPEILFPAPPGGTASATLTSTVALAVDGSGVKKTYRVAHNKEEMYVTKVGFVLTAANPVGSYTLKARILSVDAAGLPDGLLATDSESDAISLSGFSAGYREVNLVLPVTVPANTYFAVGFELSGDATNSVTFGTISIAGMAYALPYVADWDGTAWTKQGTLRRVASTLSNTTGYFRLFGMLNYSATGSEAFNAGSTPDEIGNRFIMPYSAHCSGAWAFCSVGQEAMTVSLYDSSWTLLSSTTLDRDVQATSSAGLTACGFATHVQLMKGREYFITLKPTIGSTPNTALSYLDSVSVAMMGASLGGADCYKVSRVDGGTPTTTNTRQMLIGVRLDQILI